VKEKTHQKTPQQTKTESLSTSDWSLFWVVIKWVQFCCCCCCCWWCCFYKICFQYNPKEF